MRACTVLAGVKHHSQIAAKFLDSLTELLVKYGVWSPSVTIPSATDDTPIPNEDHSQQWQLGDYSLEDSHMEQLDFDMPLLFDDLWETYVERPSAMDMIDIL